MDESSFRRQRSQEELEELVARRKENFRDKIKFTAAFVVGIVVFGIVFTMLDRESVLGPIDMSVWAHRIVVVCV